MLDAHGFADEFRESYDRLWLVAAAVSGDRASADDIVQDAAIIAYRKREQFTVGTSFLAWMTQIVRLTAFNHGRKRQTRATQPTDPQHLDQLAVRSAVEDYEFAVSPEGSLHPNQAAFDDQVLRALQGVAEVPRVCLLLRVVRDLSYAEIAQILNIPEGTAMSHVHRAKKAMREHLQNYRGTQVPPPC